MWGVWIFRFGSSSLRAIEKLSALGNVDSSGAYACGA